MSDNPTSINAEGVFEPFHISRVPFEDLRAASASACAINTSAASAGAVFPESDRVSVKLIGESYRKSSTLGYWDQVDVGPQE